jgi:hypothetical protein
MDFECLADLDLWHLFAPQNCGLNNDGRAGVHDGRHARHNVLDGPVRQFAGGPIAEA